MRSLLFFALAGLACAPGRTPVQQALLASKDCRELLLEADRARAAGDKRFARELSAACPQEGLELLAGKDASATEALLWCGRARAALDGRAEKPSCSAERVISLSAELKPLLTLGPADPESEPDPLLVAALAEVGKELNLSYDHDDPVVYVGEVKVLLDNTESETLTPAPDAAGKRHQIPATLHRMLARAEAQVELGSKTRTIHATEDARDVTWGAEPRFAIAARFKPQIPPEAELRRRAVVSLVRNIARALRISPPEGVEVTSLESCLTYGVALAVSTGDRTAAANGIGDREKLAACEKILGMPKGAGIPVP